MGSKMILKAIIDIAGKPESAVSQALDKTEERIEGIENVKVLELAKAEPELNENTNGMYTAFLDLEIECSTPRVAMQFIIDYLPTSVEIIEPSKLKISSEEFGDVLNDMVRFQIKNVNDIHNLKVHNYNLKKQIDELSKNK